MDEKTMFSSVVSLTLTSKIDH